MHYNLFDISVTITMNCLCHCHFSLSFLLQARSRVGQNKGGTKHNQGESSERVSAAGSKVCYFSRNSKEVGGKEIRFTPYNIHRIRTSALLVV